MEYNKFTNPKIISVFAILGAIVNFVVSIIFEIENRELTSLIALIGAFYCLFIFGKESRKLKYKKI